MKRVLLLSALTLLGLTVTLAFCQPPGGGGPAGRGPDGFGPGFGPPPNPVMEALDTDGDHERSAQEIEAAAASLKKLDKNSDGKLTHDELHPQMPGGRPGFAPQGGPRDRGMRRPGGPSPEGLEQNRPQGPDARGPQGPGLHGPGGPGQQGPGGPPSPEQFVEHALRFDADQDGKLNRDELLKLAEQFMQGPPAGGPPGEPGVRPADKQPARPRRPASE